MASAKILEQKQAVIDEIKQTVSDASTIVLFDYRGLTDSESKELRRSLREVGSDYKVSEFAKTHPALVLKVGIVDGEISDEAKLSQLATIPSREGLLTMLAGAMIAIPRDLSICLDLYGKQKEGE